MTLDLAVELLSVDLRSRDSKIKSSSTSDPWHSAMARFLKTSCWPTPSRISVLDLVPLRDGEWTSLNNKPLYLPSARGIGLPAHVNLRILDPRAVANKDRNAFFTQYGVQEPSISALRKLFIKANSKPRYVFEWDSKSLMWTRDHLRFMYCSQFCNPELTPEDLWNYRICSTTNRWICPSDEDVFLPSQAPYGASEILKCGDGMPGLEAAFLHDHYLATPPSVPTPDHKTWESWLCEFLGIRSRLRLVARDGKALSNTWKYVATHRPDKALGLLKHLWQFEGALIVENDTFKFEIMQMDGKELCSPPLNHTRPLERTYLPLATLQGHIRRFLEPEETFPFLSLDSGLSSEALRAKWAFLHDAFSVGTDDDLRFFLDVHACIEDANLDTDQVNRHERLIDLYVTIEAKCAASPNRELARQSVEYAVSRVLAWV